MAYYSLPHPLIPYNDGIATTSCDDVYFFSRLAVSFPLFALVQARFMLSLLIFTLFFYLFFFVYMAFNILLAPNVACPGP